jgi:hypothetical protein
VSKGGHYGTDTRARNRPVSTRSGGAKAADTKRRQEETACCEATTIKTRSKYKLHKSQLLGHQTSHGAGGGAEIWAIKHETSPFPNEEE